MLPVSLSTLSIKYHAPVSNSCYVVTAVVPTLHTRLDFGIPQIPITRFLDVWPLIFDMHYLYSFGGFWQHFTTRAMQQDRLPSKMLG